MGPEDFCRDKKIIRKEVDVGLQLQKVSVGQGKIIPLGILRALPPYGGQATTGSAYRLHSSIRYAHFRTANAAFRILNAET